MCQKVQILRSLVEQSLTAAAEEIFGLFERTIAEYEEELCRTKEENQRQRQILDSVWNPRVQIHKTDVQQVSVVKDEVPPEPQEWTSFVVQEEPEPEPPHMKEEQEELWTSQEVNITKFPSTLFLLTTEDDELNQTQTGETKEEANKVSCGGLEPASSFHPQRHIQTATDEQNENCEETEDSDEDQTLNHKPESKLPTNSSTEQMETETHGDDGGGSEPDIILVHMDNVQGRTFDSKSLLKEHMDIHTGQKLVGSSECEATFSQKKNMTQETNSPRDMMMKNELMLRDEGCKKKLYYCSVCLKTFCWKSKFEVHMRIHTGETPFCCPVCGSAFKHKISLRSHMVSHVKEKTLRCSVCHKWFRDKRTVKSHMKVHTEERSFDCSVCVKSFTSKSDLNHHMRLHTGEKRFGCSECSKRFTWKIDLVRHIRAHTGERPFPCVVCKKRFIRNYHLQTHMKIHARDRMSHSQESDQRLKKTKKKVTGM